ncbi:hypothetical protein TRSC58_07454 [Trypanosoma rangeli SC58]|uniref:Uncharacterized protein n=1 Tax=Trypanosoma rangeli SC58 TaxID=429131 RepID=A0A061IRZ0_TRYRA|nr:hypothetical protein TRSC58_07454 [Trypanosoma rangeli SC58]
MSFTPPVFTLLPWVLFEFISVFFFFPSSFLALSPPPRPQHRNGPRGKERVGEKKTGKKKVTRSTEESGERKIKGIDARVASKCRSTRT